MKNYVLILIAGIIAIAVGFWYLVKPKLDEGKAGETPSDTGTPTMMHAIVGEIEQIFGTYLGEQVVPVAKVNMNANDTMTTPVFPSQADNAAIEGMNIGKQPVSPELRTGLPPLASDPSTAPDAAPTILAQTAPVVLKGGGTITYKEIQTASGGTMMQTDVMAPQNTNVSFLTGKIANPSADYYTLMYKFHDKYGTYDFLPLLTPDEAAQLNAANIETGGTGSA